MPTWLNNSWASNTKIHYSPKHIVFDMRQSHIFWLHTQSRKHHAQRNQWNKTFLIYWTYSLNTEVLISTILQPVMTRIERFKRLLELNTWLSTACTIFFSGESRYHLRADGESTAKLFTSSIVPVSPICAKDNKQWRKDSKQWQDFDMPFVPSLDQLPFYVI